MGSDQLDSLLRPTKTVKRRKGKGFEEICRFFIFLCLLWLVSGGITGIKQGCRVAIPELDKVKNVLLPGVRLNLDLSCGLDVDLQV